MAVTIALGVSLASLRGLPGRFDPETVALLQTEKDWQTEPCINRTAADVTGSRLCRVGLPAAGRADFLLWGDSHAAAMVPAFDHAARALGRSGIYAITGGCPPLLRVDRVRAWYGRACLDFNDAVVAFAGSIAAPHTVVIAGRWALWTTGRAYKQEFLEPVFLVDAESRREGYEENPAVFERGIHRSIEALRRAGKRVVLLGPVPEVGFHVPKVLAMEHRNHLGRVIAPTLDEFFQRERLALPILEREAKALGAELVYPHEALCAGGACRVEANGRPLYRDDDHLSEQGNHEVEAMIRGILETKAAR
jgi:hypothetical protein